MLRTLIASLGLSAITSWHALLNKLCKTTPRKGVLYATYDGNKVLDPLREKLPGTLLLSPSTYRKSSFLKRRAEGKIVRFANIITTPFLGACTDEQRFRARMARFLEKNYGSWLRKNAYGKVIMIDEFSMPHTALTKAAKEQGIVTVAMQHGMINETHPGYVFSKEQGRNRVFPDYFICYGPYEQALLTERSTWKKESVKPLGCPRYDFLASLHAPKDGLKEKLGIPKDKRILFWPTQTHDRVMSKNGENELNAEAVFKAVKASRDLFLLIKFHPNENPRESEAFYRQYQKKHSLQRCAIMRYDEADTYDCIGMADCVVLKHSTVGKEAILMGTPIINLELKKSWDLSEFKALKSSMIARKEEDLAIFLNQVSTRKYREKFQKEWGAYLKRHFSNFGMATEKVVVFIEKH